MPRFFFHLEGGSTRVADDEGTELGTAQDADRHARLVAWELAKNARPDFIAGLVLVLTDDRGQRLLQIPLVGIGQPQA
jgi:uncharacterized protein DUF6894